MNRISGKDKSGKPLKRWGLKRPFSRLRKAKEALNRAAAGLACRNKPGSPRRRSGELTGNLTGSFFPLNRELFSLSRDFLDDEQGFAFPSTLAAGRSGTQASIDHRLGLAAASIPPGVPSTRSNAVPSRGTPEQAGRSRRMSKRMHCRRNPSTAGPVRAPKFDGIAICFRRSRYHRRGPSVRIDLAGRQGARRRSQKAALRRL